MLTRLQRDAILDALIDTGGPWDPLTTFVGVAEGIANQGLNCVIGDVDVPDGDAGIRKPVTAWSAAYDMTDGRTAVDSNLLEFRVGDVTEATVVSHVYVATLLTAGALKQFFAMPNQVPLPNEFAVCKVILRVTVDPNGRWDAAIVYNG